MIGQDISQIAQGYLGQEEIPSNAGFKDPEFAAEMNTTDWYKGAPWCAFLAILVWRKAYASFPNMLHWINSWMIGNSQQMARNAHADPTWPTSTTEPIIGAMAIFGDVGSTIAGHTACAVINIDPDGIHYTTVEGNTRPAGNPGNVAEGYIVATHIHTIGAPHPTSGLEFIRFILPINQNSQYWRD